MSKTRVLIVDDHAILREGVRALLSATGDLEVVGEAAGGEEAIQTATAIEPDRIRNAGASALLAKPFTMRQVVELIGDVAGARPSETKMGP